MRVIDVHELIYGAWKYALICKALLDLNRTYAEDIVSVQLLKWLCFKYTFLPRLIFTGVGTVRKAVVTLYSSALALYKQQTAKLKESGLPFFFDIHIIVALNRSRQAVLHISSHFLLTPISAIVQ